MSDSRAQCHHEWEQVSLGWEGIPAWVCFLCLYDWPVTSDPPEVGL